MSQASTGADGNFGQSGAKSYQEHLEEKTPVTVEVSEDQMNAIAVAVKLAVGVVKDMHPSDREVHTFDVPEVLSVRDDVRQKLGEVRESLRDQDGKWTEVELTADEIRAFHSGFVELETERDRDPSNAMQFAYGAISTALDEAEAR